jgi:hypothetical protein
VEGRKAISPLAIKIYLLGNPSISQPFEMSSEDAYIGLATKRVFPKEVKCIMIRKCERVDPNSDLWKCTETPVCLWPYVTDEVPSGVQVTTASYSSLEGHSSAALDWSSYQPHSRFASIDPLPFFERPYK